jgi:hypothetical protein
MRTNWYKGIKIDIYPMGYGLEQWVFHFPGKVVTRFCRY